jgi:hypothetical protein
MSGKQRLPRKRPQPVYRETPDVASATCRLIVSIGKRVATEDVDGLSSLVLLEKAVRQAWRLAIEGLRHSGVSDRDIGAQLGITRQAIEQRWPRS